MPEDNTIGSEQLIPLIADYLDPLNSEFMPCRGWGVYQAEFCPEDEEKVLQALSRIVVHGNINTSVQVNDPPNPWIPERVIIEMGGFQKPFDLYLVRIRVYRLSGEITSGLKLKLCAVIQEIGLGSR